MLPSYSQNFLLISSDRSFTQEKVALLHGLLQKAFSQCLREYGGLEIRTERETGNLLLMAPLESKS